VRRPSWLFITVIWIACGGTPQAARAPEREKLELPEATKQLVMERAVPVAESEPAPLLQILEQELARGMQELGEKADPPPYFLAYEVTEGHGFTVTGSFGALVSSDDSRGRLLDVAIRVGEHALDNTHAVRDIPEGLSSMMDRGPVRLPLGDDPLAIKNALWLATDRKYKAAAERLIKVKASKRVKVEEEDRSDDFSRESRAVFIEPPLGLDLERARWEKRIRDWSAMFRAHPRILSSRVQIWANAQTRYLVNSEGSRIQTSGTRFRLAVSAAARADDGMWLHRFESFDAESEEALPDDAAVRACIEELTGQVLELREAPLAEPYSGPALLSGEAAAVFFHEIVGHRLEGHRQKDEEEGQTFARKLGEKVMPDFIDLYDDPGIRVLNGTSLNGYYRFDDEAVPAQKALLIERGILRTFLMSRAPARGIDRSNGHGRRQPGYAAVARQANLVVDPARTTSAGALRGALLEEVRRQKMPYGLRFARIEGGFTLTGRALPQGFKINPVMVYRVYPDGREQLVRGVDMEGTPLSALSELIAADNEFRVYNGYCGAESGSVPVSAVSPALLLRKIEVSRKSKSAERPPLLGPPPPRAAAGPGAEGGGA
jgi:TldD protein